MRGDAIVARLMREYRGQTVVMLAPLVVNRKGVYTDLAAWAAGAHPRVGVQPRRAADYVRSAKHFPTSVSPLGAPVESSKGAT